MAGSGTRGTGQVNTGNDLQPGVYSDVTVFEAEDKCVLKLHISGFIGFVLAPGKGHGARLSGRQRA